MVLYLAPAFLITALMSGALAFGGLAGSATGIVKGLFLLFVALFVASLVIAGRYAE